MSDFMENIIREDLLGFTGYSSARSLKLSGDIWLNANESAWNNPADTQGTCRRYCEGQPPALKEKLAHLYGCEESQLLIGRGSDEMIDLVVRATCVPQRDAVVCTPPIFGMYAVSTRLQNALLIEVPLLDTDTGLEINSEAILQAATQNPIKLLFLCSPSNPGGKCIPLDKIKQLAEKLSTTLVVVDEAYIEFSATPSTITLLNNYENIAVLRTLSKAHALAAARIGCLIAHKSLIQRLRQCQAPYPVAAPCVALALAGLSDEALEQTRSRIVLIRKERKQLHKALENYSLVRRVYASDANFLLVRFKNTQKVFDSLLAAGIVVRDQRAAPQLHDALRITIGTPQQNKRVLSVLSSLEISP